MSGKRRRDKGWADACRRGCRCRRVVRGLRHEDVMLLASSLSFYALVSIIPTVILVLWVAGVIAGHHQVQDFADTLANYVPKKLGIDKVARQIAKLGGSVGAVAIVGMVWPSTAYGVGLLRAFDRLGHGGGQSHKGIAGPAEGAQLHRLPARADRRRPPDLLRHDQADRRDPAERLRLRAARS